MSDSGPGRWFEDFRVGERFTSAPRTVTETDLLDFTRLSGDDHPIHTGPAAILQGPFGIAIALGLLQSLGLHGSAVRGLLDTHWTYRLPIRVGDTLRLELTVIRCHRTRGGTRGTVGRHMALVNAHGHVVQEGTSTALLSARGTGPDPVNRAFGTVAWGEALVQRLGSDFAESTATWDGTIGLRAGGDEVHLRVYRGTIVEVTARAPHGATFSMEADAITWTELVEADRNEFMRYAMTGRLTSHGDGYEYLRLTSTLSMIVDAARRLAEEKS